MRLSRIGYQRWLVWRSQSMSVFWGAGSSSQCCSLRGDNLRQG
jgi:hypothetical protein